SSPSSCRKAARANVGWPGASVTNSAHNSSTKAFSTESLPRTRCGADTASRQENASKYGASVLIQPEPRLLIEETFNTPRRSAALVPMREFGIDELPHAVPF